MDGDFAVFWKRDKAEDAVVSAVRDISAIHVSQNGSNRRVTGLMPVATGQHEITHTGTLKFHQLLVSLEGNKRTGCLRIVSPSRRSRSAILIYRGRVVGCLYGSRKFDNHFLQHDAHRRALADLATPGNVLDAYELPEELVLAACSMFNGQVLKIDMQQESTDMMDQALRTIAETRLPGCVVVNTIDDEMVCMVYVFDGKIIGVFSSQDGWVKPSYDAAMKYTRCKRPTKVVASCLPTADREQAETLGFSLTGLSDMVYRPAHLLRSLQTTTMQAAASMRGDESHTYSTMEQMMPKPMRKKENIEPRWTKDQISTVKSHNVFAICP